VEPVLYIALSMPSGTKAKQSQSKTQKTQNRTKTVPLITGKKV
jgi:hypothetical protein